MEQTKREKIILHVRDLLESGQVEAKKHKSLVDTEGHKYFRAQDYLIEQAIELDYDEELEKSFNDLVPQNGVLKLKLKNELADVQSKDVAKRLRAAQALSDEAGSLLTGERELWLRHPDTVRIIRTALENEDDPEIQLHLIRSLGTIYNRNLKDPRICDLVIPFLRAKNPSIVRAAIIASRGMEDRRKWDLIILLLRKCNAMSTMEALLLHLWEVPAEVKRPAIESLVDFFVRKKIKSVSGRDIASRIYELVDENNIEWFREHYIQKRNRSLDSSMKWASEMCLENKPIHDFLREIGLVKSGTE